ncbi:MAG: polyprenyl diphosphate synthase [Pseudomonadota bacterium]
MSFVTPQHIAIIMDGNGRWAKARGLPRTAGHRQGIEATKRVVRASRDMGISYLTLFGFSAENWSRPKDEVQELMGLLRMYLQMETKTLHQDGVRLRMIGDRDGLDRDIVTLIEKAEALTRDNTALHLTIALNYGGRQEITQAAYAMAQDCVAAGQMPDKAAFAAAFPAKLLTPDLPEPDILVRSSGEQRISNFLLWQCAYAEFVFSPVLWPDFDRDHLAAVIGEFAKRDRRFGAVK